MEKPIVNPPEKDRDAKKNDRTAKERLSKPPKDPREVTIGPTTGTGPDVTLR